MLVLEAAGMQLSDICNPSNTKSSPNLGREPWQLWATEDGVREEQLV